jgi:hypothetical protein
MVTTCSAVDLTHRVVAEEDAQGDTGTSKGPQTKIARFNEKIAQLEKSLQAKDIARIEYNEDEDARNSQTGEKPEDHDDKEVAKKESCGVGNSEMANFLRERKKEEQAWKERFMKLEQQYGLLAGLSQSQDKRKVSLADNHFLNASSPFVDHITSYRLPEKFKIPDIPVYSGQENLIEC